MERIIVYALPVFALLILGEYAYGVAKGKNNYRVNDAVASLSQGILSQITVVFTQVFQLGIYTFVYSKMAFFHHEGFWNAWYGWLLAMILADFFGYWHHRYSHETGILWAAHVVHHQSQEFNFSTALRQESAYPVLGWIFYLPMALLGVPPLVYAVAGLAVLLYQLWIHTEHVGKLGWFDYVFSSPSNHRVHHAVNDCYIDKNYGGMLIIWDRLFGTFEEEGDEKCIYGTRPDLNSWDPVWANLVVYWGLLRDALQAVHFRDKFKIFFMPPGWKPEGALEKPKFDISSVKTFDPQVQTSALWFGAFQFLVFLVASAALLWYLDDLAWIRSAVFVLSITSGLWATGKVLEGRMKIGSALLVDLGAALCALVVL